MKTRFPYKRGERVFIVEGKNRNLSDGTFVRYTKKGTIIVKFLGTLMEHPQKEISPFYNQLRRKR